MTTNLSPALRAVSDAVLAIGAQVSVEEVLQRLVDAARTLVPARYAALGVPDGEGGFSAFLTSGMSEKLMASLGPLPRTHGMLGAMLETPPPFRTPDIHDDPRFRGWWKAKFGPTSASNATTLPPCPSAGEGARGRGPPAKTRPPAYLTGGRESEDNNRDEFFMRAAPLKRRPRSYSSFESLL